MKKICAAIFALGLASAPAFADEFEDYCVGYTTERGGDSSGCSCLAEAADDSMREELMKIASAADMEELSDASKEAIATCWPDAV